MYKYFELAFSGLGLFNSYFALLSVLFYYFENIISWLGLSGNTEFVLFLFFYVILYFVVLYLLGLFFSRIFKSKKISFGENVKYFSWTYLVIPVLMFVYPFILGTSDTNMRKQWKHVLFGIAVCTSFILYHEGIGGGAPFGLSILYFFPCIVVLLLLWKAKNISQNTIKYTVIMMLIIVLLTQPFYKKWFYDRENPENQKICYSRSLENSDERACFKIFEAVKIKKYFDL